MTCRFPLAVSIFLLRMSVKINTIKYKTGTNTVIVMHDKRYLCLVTGSGVVLCFVVCCVVLCCVVLCCVVLCCVVLCCVVLCCVVLCCVVLCCVVLCCVVCEHQKRTRTDLC